MGCVRSHGPVLCGRAGHGRCVHQGRAHQGQQGGRRRRQGHADRRIRFHARQGLEGQAIKEISWLTLKPGDSIGYHKHTTNEDTYIIISGRGTFKDKDGKDVPVKAGDVTIVRKNESHGLVNTGTEPLVFVDVIAEQ